ncbi:uncharacterized protein LOC109823682 isoform X2 [Asparagus officinalis]|uniref:uncharacterized protein LOC109823682 isoform X2 n=1 Tax=Asparagus officinalis TaxID=4686 RepID=UPI00098E2D05|nr:uncharacterized protein LOC109823682 isoform X2 [Asparagus officinalis]
MNRQLIQLAPQDIINCYAYHYSPQCKIDTAGCYIDSIIRAFEYIKQRVMMYERNCPFDKRKEDSMDEEMRTIVEVCIYSIEQGEEWCCCQALFDEFYNDGPNEMIDQEWETYRDAMKRNDGFEVPELHYVFTFGLIKPTMNGYPVEIICKYALFAINHRNKERLKEVLLLILLPPIRTRYSMRCPSCSNPIQKHFGSARG